MAGGWRLLLLGLLVFSGGVQAITVGFHSDEPAPTVVRLLAASLPDELALQLRPFDDAAELHTAVTAGDVDVAVIEEPLQALPDVSLISSLYPAVLHLLVHGPATDDLGELLNSGALWAGAPGGIGQQLATQLATDYGAPEPKLLADPWTVDPEVYFVFGGLLSNDALSRLADGFRLHSLGDAGATDGGSIADAITLRYPNLRTLRLPAETYPQLSREPIMTVAVQSLLVAGPGLDEDLAYTLAQAVDHLQPVIAATYPLAALMADDATTQIARAIPLHPGARRYRDRELPSFLERYAEFVGATVTTAIALISLGFAWYRRRKQARKDRLDSYYQQALACRQDLESGAQPATGIARRLRDLQQEVFQLLMAERIDADSSLVVFLALSNQLLHEAGQAPSD